ncbi:MAG: recombinase RecT [Shewanella sp.]
MSAIANHQSSILPRLLLSEQDLETLSRSGIIPQGTPPAQVAVFAKACSDHGLSPFKKEIYLIGQGGKYHIVVGIDGMRSKAARTGQLAGCTDAKFNMSSDGTFLTAADVKASGKMPISATVTVFRIVCGIKCEFTHTAAFSEFYPQVASGGGGFSKASTMQCQMIAKVAESFAIKKGFADETAGLHIEEEASAFQATQKDIVLPDTVWMEKIREQMDGFQLAPMMEYWDFVKQGADATNPETIPEQRAITLAAFYMANEAKDSRELDLVRGCLGPKSLSIPSVSACIVAAKNRISK